MNRNIAQSRICNCLSLYAMFVIAAIACSAAGTCWGQQDKPISKVDHVRIPMREKCFWFDCPEGTREIAVTAEEFELLDEVTYGLFVEINRAAKIPQLTEQFDAKDFVQRLDNSFEEIFGRDRMKRQKELAARFEFRKNGLAAAVKKYSDAKFSVKGSALSKYRRVAKKLDEQVHQQSEDLRQECLADLTDVLNANQRQRMQDFLRLSSSRPFKPPSLERLVWQLNNLEKIQRTLQVSDITSFEEMFWENGRFRISTSGICESRLPGFPSHRDTVDLTPDELAFQIGTIILSKVPTNRLESHQAGVLKRLMAERDRFNNSEDNRIGGKRTEFCKKMLQQVEALLTPEQSTNLKLSQSRYMLDTGGFVACVTAGELANVLKVTPQQKRQFEDKATKHSQEIAAKTIDIEEETLQALIEALPKKHQAQVKKTFGAKPKHARADLDLLVQLLNQS